MRERIRKKVKRNEPLKLKHLFSPWFVNFLLTSSHSLFPFPNQRNSLLRYLQPPIFARSKITERKNVQKLRKFGRASYFCSCTLRWWCIVARALRTIHAVHVTEKGKVSSSPWKNVHLFWRAENVVESHWILAQNVTTEKTIRMVKRLNGEGGIIIFKRGYLFAWRGPTSSYFVSNQCIKRWVLETDLYTTRSIFDDSRKNFEFSASRAKLWSNVAETNISHGIKYCAVFIKRKTHLWNFSNLNHFFWDFFKTILYRILYVAIS